MMSPYFWVRLPVTGLVVATTATGTYAFAQLLLYDKITVLDVLLLGIFVLLYCWLSIAFWIATLGLVLCLLHRGPTRRWLDAGRVDPREYENLPPTAMIIPVHNEDPSRVFSNLLAMYESLQETGHAEPIDFLVLSDTTDPETWVVEELAWATTRRVAAGPARIYYRRRPKNTGRKSGNVRDFCERWGARYKYMVVLDADSIMDGWTVLAMIRRMETNERIGILQVPPISVNRETVFARMQQFASRVYGQVYVRGYAFWSQGQSNYWGHNAIIRIKPFMECCGLPNLPGRAPLGGEILSHDFVEAALMLRAGWEVRVADDLEGSYEEPPTTILDFVTRSRRWCQGDLQHLRLILLQGFHAVSRVYFGMGAMVYLSSLLWLLFVVLTLIDGIQAPGHTTTFLMGMTLALLFLPKVWGYVALLHDRAQVRWHGGFGKAALSVILEAAISVLTAPIFMLFNARFVLAILSGRPVEWNAQRREDAVTRLSEAARRYAVHTSAGVAGIVALASVGSLGQVWLLLLLAGLLLSVPLEIGLSSLGLGRRLRDIGLFLGQEEVQPPRVLQRQRILRDEVRRVLHFHGRNEIFRRVVLDAALNEIHIGILQAQGLGREPWDQVAAIAHVGLYGGPEHLTQKDRLALLSNQAAMRWLHRHAWQRWEI